MKLLNFIDRGIAVVALANAWVAVLVMIGVRCFDIIAGQFMRTPSGLLALYENQAFMMLVLFGLAYGYSSHAHVRVDVLRERLSLRARVWIELAGGLLALLPLSLLLVVLSIPAVRNDYDVGSPAWVLFGLPYGWVIKAMMPVAFALLGLSGLTAVVRGGLYLAGRLPAPFVDRR